MTTTKNPNATRLFSLSRFSGMNNVEKSFRMPVTRDAHYNVLSDVSIIENLDIDNSMALSSRAGSDLKLAGTTFHSLWSDEDILCLFVDGTALYRLTPQYTAVSIGEVGSARMSYAPWNDKVYMTNESYIGYYKNDSLTAVADPGVTYKLPLPAGKFIAYYRGRLYVAKGNVLYISDALSDHYDVRNGFKTFANNITMLIAVDKGLYIADGKTWFLPGAEPDEFQKDKVSDADAIPYTAVSIDGEKLGGGVDGNFAIWTATDGICLGDNGGKVKNLTQSRFAMSSHGIGGAVVRTVNGKSHYIVTLE